MTERALRVREALDQWLGVAVVALLVVAGVGGVVTHGAYVDPGMRTEQRVVDEWSTSGSFDHEATVTEAARGTPFEPGQVVQNRGAYFTRIMPVLTGRFVFQSPGAENPVNLTVDSRLVVRSVGGDAGEDGATVYWERTRRFGTTQTVHEPGERTVVPFQFNVTRTVQNAENVSERLNSPGDIQVRVLVTAVATRQTPEAETRQLEYNLTIQDQGGVYSVQSEPRSETYTERETFTVETEPSTLEEVGGPLLVALGLLGAAGLGVGRWKRVFALSDDERDWLDYRDDRVEFDEWISTVRLPGEARDRPVAEAETLADLVDVAIDTDSAVLETPGGDAYYVVHDGYLYRYDAPAEPEADEPRLLGDASTSSDEDAVATANGGDEADDQSGE